jgi:hypothetical protein
MGFRLKNKNLRYKLGFVEDYEHGAVLPDEKDTIIKCDNKIMPIAV